MRKLLIVSVLFFAVLSVIFLISWRLTTNSTDQESWFLQFNWYTLGFTFCLGATLLSFGLLHIRLSGRGLPLEHLKTGLYPKSSIVGELKGKESPEKEGELLLFVGSKRSSVPRYARMPKLDFVKIDPEGNTLKVLKKSSHTMEGRRVNVRQLIFFKQGK